MVSKIIRNIIAFLIILAGCHTTVDSVDTQNKWQTSAGLFITVIGTWAMSPIDIKINE